MKMTEAYPQLMDSLHHLRRRWRLRTVAEGVLLAFAGTLVVLLAVVAADNLLHLEKVGRFILALLLWGSLAAALVTLVIRRCLEDRRDDFFAALVEQRHPELRNQLINALQLGRGHQNGHSPRLIEAIVNDAANAIADLDMAGSIDRRPAKRAALLALAAVMVIVGYAAAVSPPRFGNGLARVLLPAADIAPYSATRVTVHHENNRVAEGTPVRIAAQVAGLIPSSAELHLQAGDGRWQSFDMSPNTEGDAFRFKVQQAVQSFDYYVTAGDGRSPKYHVEVVKRPQIEKLAVTYAAPAYTGLPPRQVSEADGEIGDIAGTTVTVQVTATKPLREAQLITKSGPAEPVVIALERGVADNLWQGSFVLWTPDAKGGQDILGTRIVAPGQYQIHLLDTDGYDNLDPLWRSITLAKDQPPSVRITTPGQDRQIKPGEPVVLTVEAEDDYGIDAVRLEYRVYKNGQAYEKDKPFAPLAQVFAHQGPPELYTKDAYDWATTSLNLKPGDRVEYRAAVTDRNTITGPGQGHSRPFSLTVMMSAELVKQLLDEQIPDFAAALEILLKLQRENQAQTSSRLPFGPLVTRQVEIRKKTGELARRMDESALPVATIVRSLDALHADLMVEAVRLLEKGRDSAEQDAADKHRAASVVVQDKIIAELEALLLRLQRNEQAKKELRRIEKKDPLAHKKITERLSQMVKDLDQLLKDQTELVGKFERMPKKTDDAKEDELKLTKEMDAIQKKWEQWAKGTVEELAKLPTGFVDDFKLRKDVNKIYEEIEKAAQRSKAEKIEVSLEDMGVGLATKMKEDLETWMPDSPDATKWVMEEPLNKKTPKVPEMPLPKALEDLIGDLLQKADEFDEEADDITSAWGDNLDQAGWGVSDGPISSFSAKGKTGNDLPNNNEVNGRSGDGRRGKSSGQMVGDTARGLQGRKTPARVGNERYEPGQLKQEGTDDPNGATGGGKKAGAGRKGLQGGTPPDVTKDIGRLSAKQAGLREKAEQVAKKLDTAGIKSGRLQDGIKMLMESDKDLRDLRYDDAARKRKLALGSFKAAALEIDQSNALNLSRARDLPPELRNELLQGADDGYPPGYESLLKNYYKELSKAEK